MMPPIKMAEGIYSDLPADAYHASEGVSHSMLKAMRPTPAHLPAYLAEKREPTPAMTLGTLTHCKVLEPDKPLPRLAIKPGNMTFVTKEGKAWRAEQRAAKRLIVTQAEHASLEGMTRTIAQDETCQQILGQGCKTELSVFRNFSLGGTVLRKARMDIVPPGNALADIKTTIDASPEAFAKALLPVECGGMGYATQAAYYLDIWNDSCERQSDMKECFIFIVVEKEAPYLVAVYNVEPRAIAVGRRSNIEALQTYIACSTNGEWPGYPKGIQNLDLPASYYKRNQTHPLF
jgi:exodeoxyribonuclease VIII